MTAAQRRPFARWLLQFEGWRLYFIDNGRARSDDEVCMPKRQLRQSLVVLTALLVLLMAGLAGGSLWILRRLHDQTTHAAAARLVLDQGERIVTHLAGQPLVRGPAQEAANWTPFSEQIRAFHMLEDGLQYVSVIKNGITVFHEQTRGLNPGDVLPIPGHASEPGATRVSRGLLDLGDERVPVVVFSKTLIAPDGAPTVVDVAVRKEAVSRAEKTAMQALASMFKLSLVTVLISFGTCALLVGWMMRREAHREHRRRAEEHLTFAGVMANGIVHDFRNPMSAMRLDVQMLGREARKGDACRLSRVAELAGRIEQTIERMDKVFQEFLFMSKPPADQREAVDLARCVQESVALLRPRLEQAGLDVHLDVPDGPLSVLVYPSAMQRALVNVLINAEQASPRGGALRVRAWLQDQSAVLDVTDSGPGVPVEARERIFDMFYTTRPSGTGLGLFLARTAITRSGGTIRVVDASQPGGACFRITLPLALQPVETQEQPLRA